MFINWPRIYAPQHCIYLIPDWSYIVFPQDTFQLSHTYKHWTAWYSVLGEGGNPNSKASNQRHKIHNNNESCLWTDCKHQNFLTLGEFVNKAVHYIIELVALYVCEHWVLQTFPHPVHVQGNQESAWASTLRLQVNSSAHLNPQAQKLWVIDLALNDCLAMPWGFDGKENKPKTFRNQSISPELTDQLRNLWCSC